MRKLYNWRNVMMKLKEEEENLKEEEEKLM